MQSDPIPASVLAQLQDSSNQLLVSLIMPWEMQIKAGIGKLKLGDAVRSIFQNQLALSSMTALPITLDHIQTLDSLPQHHRDTFDRLLIAQAIHEALTIVTSDPQIPRYPVKTLWG